MNLLLTIGVAAGALALVGVLLNRRSKVVDDGVAEFRRQLGALSPDASRPVIRPRQDHTSADEASHGRSDGRGHREQEANEDDHGA